MKPLRFFSTHSTIELVFGLVALAAIIAIAIPLKARAQNRAADAVVTAEMLSRCIGCDAHGMNFRNRDLHGIRIVGADLHDADLRNANLRGTRMSGVDLRNAKLDGADLRDARIAGAALAGASFAGAHLEGARIAGARDSIRAGSRMRDAKKYCVGCDLHDPAVRRRVGTPTASSSAAPAAGANFRNANLSGAHLTGSNLAGADFSGADLSNARLTGDDFANANLAGANLHGATLCSSGIGRLAVRVRVERDGKGAAPATPPAPPSPAAIAQRPGGHLACVNLRGANLRNADLRGTQVCEGLFFGIDMMPQLLRVRRLNVEDGASFLPDFEGETATIRIARGDDPAAPAAPAAPVAPPAPAAGASHGPCRPATAEELRTRAGATLEGATFDGPAS